MQNLRRGIIKLISKSTLISLIFLTGCTTWLPVLFDDIDDAIEEEISLNIDHAMSEHDKK